MQKTTNVICPLTGERCSQGCELPKMPDAIEHLDRISRQVFQVPFGDKFRDLALKDRQSILQAIRTDLAKEGRTFVCPQEGKPL